MKFTDEHPGSGFAYLSLMSRLKVPVTSIPEGKLCTIEELDINNENPSDLIKEKRENYAKMALLMFCPFRELDDLKHEGSYWQKFDAFRKQHFQGDDTKVTRFEIPPKNLDVDTIKDNQYLSTDDDNDERISGENGGIPENDAENEKRGWTVFWIKGFEILQNVDDRVSVEKCQGRASDVLSDEAPDLHFDDDAAGTTHNMEEDSDDDSYDSADKVAKPRVTDKADEATRHCARRGRVAVAHKSAMAT